VGVLFRVLARLADIHSFARGPKAVAARQARRVIYRATNHRWAIGGRRNPKLTRPPTKTEFLYGAALPATSAPPQPPASAAHPHARGLFMNFV
jgi:hypothetical protein